MTTVWLLDVDGVVNAPRAGWGAAPSRTRVAGFTIRWEPRLIDAVRAFHLRRDASVRWCTTWCDFPEELRRLEVELGLELCLRPAFKPGSSLTVSLRKLDAARAVLAAGDRLIWTDDDEVDPRTCAEFADAVVARRALLIAPRPSHGLRQEDVARIEAFSTDANVEEKASGESVG